MTDKKKKIKITSDALVYLNISHMAAHMNWLMEIYCAYWMPEKLQKPYKKLMWDISALEIIALEMADVEIENEK